MAELDIPALIAEMEAAAETVEVDTESLRVGESNELKVLAQRCRYLLYLFCTW